MKKPHQSSAPTRSNPIVIQVNHKDFGITFWPTPVDYDIERTSEIENFGKVVAIFKPKQ